MKKSSKEKGNDFEEKCQRTINSGAFFQKGDIQTKDLCLECKYTDKKGFRISTKILTKLWNEALDSNKLPMLIIGIKNDNVQWTLKCEIQKDTI
jgi:hypothetical protein